MIIIAIIMGINTPSICKALVKHWVLETQPLQRQAPFLKMEAKALSELTSRMELPLNWRDHPHTCLWRLLRLRLKRYLCWPHPNTPAVYTAGGSAGWQSRPSLLTSGVPFCPSPFSFPYGKLFIIHDYHPFGIFPHFLPFPPSQRAFQPLLCLLKHKDGDNKKKERVNSELGDVGATKDSRKGSLEINGQKAELWLHKTWTSFISLSLSTFVQMT